MNLQDSSRKQKKYDLPPTPTLKETLGDMKWLKVNEERVRALLPENWVSRDTLTPARLGPALLTIGVPINTLEEFSQVLVFLTRVGILLRDGHRVSRCSRSIFLVDTESPH